jgi:hypothetical protein
MLCGAVPCRAVTSHMEPECKELMMDAIDVNYIDTEE